MNHLDLRVMRYIYFFLTKSQQDMAYLSLNTTKLEKFIWCSHAEDNLHLLDDFINVRHQGLQFVPLDCTQWDTWQRDLHMIHSEKVCFLHVYLMFCEKIVEEHISQLHKLHSFKPYYNTKNYRQATHYNLHINASIISKTRMQECW